MFTKTMHQQVFLLASAQALFQIVYVAVMTIGALAGAAISGSARWATLPIASMFLGTAVMMFPASLWMAKVGRRAGFLLGAVLGTVGGLIASLGIAQNSLTILGAGTFLIGCYQAFAQFYRFAASEIADSTFRPRAISLVLAGGVAAALIGPALAQLGGPLMHPQYLGSFLIIAMLCLVSIGVLQGFHVPPVYAAVTDKDTPARPWLAIVTQPTYLVALFGGATSYGIMILAMTATPLAMLLHSHELGTAAAVIQLHVLAMFLPSFFTGSLISQFGVLRVMLMGALLFVGHILLTLTGTSLLSFMSSLISLGIGWNFMYIGGTTLLTSTYSPLEKSRAQATNDMVIFIVGVLCSFSAGWLLEVIGWSLMNLILLPWLALSVLSLFWLQRRTTPIK
ncbi:MFS transporter [Paenalcaligenes suwonensis]|uniref:MFS transporter n=1 Tax=Paenalcaligenes suwonensis TaxID=1202713 RepID=UPI00140A6961|nr:MFS transporter [Paenalcaligenes suwonensis]NHC61685.1 MFS transporter [Paenalcaligenes suwonensis]